MRQLGDRGIEEWRRTDRLDVFHYGYGRMMPVHYELYTDARRYDCMSAALTMPIQIFQGRRDDAVDPATVEHVGAAAGRTSSCTCSTTTTSCTRAWTTSGGRSRGFSSSVTKPRWTPPFAARLP